MDLQNIFITAWQSLARNKTRTLLTILGIVIGVGSVILLMSIGDGLKKYVSGQFEALGSNIIIVFPVNLVDEQGRPASFRGGGPPVGGKTFSEKDVREIRKLHSGIAKVNPQVQKLIRVKSVSKQKQLNVVGATYEYKEIRSITIAGGRFYNESEVNRAKKVAVLGPTAARDLFPDGNSLGKSIYISSVAFEIIGVTDPRGGGGGFYRCQSRQPESNRRSHRGYQNSSFKKPKSRYLQRS